MNIFSLKHQVKITTFSLCSYVLILIYKKRVCNKPITTINFIIKINISSRYFLLVFIRINPFKNNFILKLFIKTVINKYTYMSTNNVKCFDLPKFVKSLMATDEIIISWSVVINRNVYISDKAS